MMELMHGLYHGSPRVVKLEVELHHGCSNSDHKSPEVVNLVMRLHQGCYIREHEVSRGGEANDEASLPKMQEGEIHDGTSSWKFQGV